MAVGLLGAGVQRRAVALFHACGSRARAGRIRRAAPALWRTLSARSRLGSRERNIPPRARWGIGSLLAAWPRCSCSGLQLPMFVAEMSAQRAAQANAVRVPSPPSALPEQPPDDLRRLGEALQAHTPDVLRETVARTVGSGEAVDTLVQDSFERICSGSTGGGGGW